jgi:type IV pilus assembly protein PilN
MDLERVLPAGVQVTSIEPAVTAEGDVNIRLRVTGDRDLTVDLVRNLEHSQRFLSPHLINESAQTKEQAGMVQVAQNGLPSGVQFDIMSGYNPLPESAKDREEQAKKDKEAAQQSEAPKPTPQVTLKKPVVIANKPPIPPARPVAKNSAVNNKPIKPSANGGSR